ncbi:MAG: carboxypeptidase-like regulatory domain-containing protein [Planctomycetes bacterium]|nr:carboxypeptidase-like regulatory domain-containing protein [Planctomycetota bacterium]
MKSLLRWIPWFRTARDWGATGMTAAVAGRARRTLATAAILAVVLGGAVLFLRGRPEKAPSPSPSAADARDAILESGPAEAAFPPAPVVREAIFETAAASESDPEEREATEAMGALEVRVVDPWDRLVESAEIRARRLDVSDAEPILHPRGERTFDLPLGVPHRIDVLTHLCFEPAVREPVYAEWGTVTVQLASRCARISGRVVEAETGETLSYAQLAYKAERGSGGASGGSGAFDLLVPAGDLRLVAGAAERETAIGKFRLGSGEWLRDVEIPLAKVPRVVVEGRVLDAGGSPVIGAKVTFGTVTEARTEFSSAESREVLGKTRTGDSGSFEVSVPAGTAVLHVEAAGFEPSGPISFEVRGSREEVEITLARGGRLRIRGIRADGSAVAPTEITVRREAEVMLRARGGYVERAVLRAKVSGSARVYSMGRESLGTERAAVDREKYLTIEGVPLGEYLVVVTAGAFKGEAMAFLPAVETVVVDVPVAESRDGK